MKTNVGKTKLIRISWEPSPVRLKNVEFFNYLGSMITKGARTTREIISKFAMAKAVFNKAKTLFTSRLDLLVNLSKKLVKCYIWSTALIGSENWTLRKVDQEYLESSKVWNWRMEEISWTNSVRNEALHRDKEKRNFEHIIKRRKDNWIGHILRRNCWLEHIIQGNMIR
jgi:hypothetical protein